MPDHLTDKDYEHNCDFCDIAKALDGVQTIEETQNPRTSHTRVIMHDENLTVIKDLRPTIEHHYLVIPRKHVGNPKTLSAQTHIDLILQMHEFGQKFLKETGLCDDVTEASFGFHYPPYISEEHLHLHVLYPTSDVTSRKYKESSWFFLTPTQLIETIQKKMKKNIAKN